MDTKRLNQAIIAHRSVIASGKDTARAAKRHSKQPIKEHQPVSPVTKTGEVKISAKRRKQIKQTLKEAGILAHDGRIRKLHIEN
ncbi:MAG: hypothetical protein ABW170_06330 [Candidatus Thiodiazotropha sp. L084R]